MNIKQSASITAILVAVVLTGAGCLDRQQPATARPTTVPAASVPAAEPKLVGGNPDPIFTKDQIADIPAERRGAGTTIPNEPIVTSSSTSSATKDVRDERTKVAFSYPASLGEITTRNEFGWGMEEDEATVTNFTCLEQRAFNLDGTPFLVVNDTWQCQTLGRGGYWGDQARAFSTEEDVKKWCESKDVCTPYVNPNGVTIYHAYTKSDEFWGEPIVDIDKYGAWNPNKDIHGILISNQGFVENGQGRMQEEVKAIADSLSFLE